MFSSFYCCYCCEWITVLRLVQNLKFGCVNISREFGLKARYSVLCRVLSALAASCCYSQNLNLYTCIMLNLVTQLGFVTVLMRIYIFELLVLTLICKELALLACRLTIVDPVTHKHRHTSLDSSVSDFQGHAALHVFSMSHELWSCCMSWYHCETHWWQLDVPC